MRSGPEKVLKLVAIVMGGIALMAAAIELKDAVQQERGAPSAAPVDDPLRAELARCRTLTPERLQTDTACREAWAENRKRFFDGPPQRGLKD